MQPTGFVINNNSLLSSSADTDLSKVMSFDKQQELFNILHSEDACHYERLHLVGFLKFVGYSLEGICSIIDQEASWGDYDRVMTYCQVRSVFKPCGKETIPQHPFLNNFAEGVIGETTFIKGVSSICADEYEPKICIIGNTRITCYFKKCALCNLKVIA